MTIIGQMKTETIVSKPNQVLVLLQKNGKLTSIERKLLNSFLLASTQQHREYVTTFGRQPDNSHMYSARAQELLETVEVGNSNLMSTIRKHILALRRVESDWFAPDVKEGVVMANTSFLSEVRMEIKNGSLQVYWAFPPSLNTMLGDPKSFPFTKLDLQKISLLTSYTAVALYEICAKYRSNYKRGGSGECLTTKRTPEWWVNALTNTAPKIDKGTGLPVHREWRKIKNETVNKAIDEINLLTDLDIRLLEEKSGKSVNLVQFEVRSKKDEPRKIEAAHFELLKKAIGLGVPEELLKAAINRTSADQVGLCLAKLESRISQTDLPVIDNVGRYFNTIVSDTAPIEVVEDISPAKEAKNSNTDTRIESNEKSDQTIAKEAFMLLPDSAKRTYSSKAVEELKARGLATERILSNAHAGVWSGSLLSQMIEIFRREIEVKLV
jgi:plasmid replication initiation protein